MIVLIVWENLCQLLAASEKNYIISFSRAPKTNAEATNIASYAAQP